MEVKLYNKEGGEIGTVALNDEIFGIEPKAELVHQYVVNYLANQRQGNSSSKTRAAVNGGGAKPWRQKGTGRARAGTSRSPIWRGGGIIFGPSPRCYYNRFPKTMKKVAMKSALSDKAQNQNVMIVDDLNVDQVKTKTVSGFLNSLGLKDKKCLVLDGGKNERLAMSARNIPKVKYSYAALANTFDVVHADVLLMTKSGLDKIEETLTK